MKTTLTATTPKQAVNPYVESLDNLQEIYLDWVNNYLTAEKFAKDYDMMTADAKVAIEAGRLVHEMRVVYNKA